MMGHSKPYKKPHGEKSMTVETIMSKRASTSQIGVYDAALATLFADSLGPVKPIARQSPQRAFTSEGPSTTELSHYPYEAKVTEQDTLSKTSNEQVQQDISQLRHPYAERLNKLEERLPRRKRKRRDIEDDLEGEYMNDLAKQQLKEDEQKAGRIQLKRPKNQHLRTDDKDNGIRDAGEQSPSGSVDTAMGDEENTSAEGIPQHESVVRSREDLDLEKSSRTVFLANVSTMAIKSKTAKKTLLDHLASFTSTLPRQDIKHGVESLRFRSTAFSSTSVPRKAAYAKKELMDTTTKSTNAYVVYTTQMAAREALKRLNGTMVLDRHLRVDSVAHPAKIDHRRCVFVGNLGFVDNTTTIDAVEDEKNNKRPRKAKEPADIEEGLWRQFEKVGRVESVRVVRDKTTRVGKGFAYVQFENANAVETALLYNEKRFPPMLPRTLRVTRAKNIKKASGDKDKRATLQGKNGSARDYKPKIPSGMQSLTGRASKLLGRAGGAKLRAAGQKSISMTKQVNGIAKNPESIVFEGYRASSHQGKGVLKSKGSGKKRGKPSERSRTFKGQGKKRGGL